MSESENINTTEVQTAAADATAADAARKPHRRRTIKDAIADNSMIVGAVIGAAISTPIAVFFSRRHLKNKWLKAAAEFDAAVAADAT